MIRPRPEGSLVSSYLERLIATEERGDAREESFYPVLAGLLTGWAGHNGRRDVHVTTIPKQTRGCSLDFQVWQGRDRLVGYIEAKRPRMELREAETRSQVKRYLETFPNLILTNFRELRLFRNGEVVARATLSGAWPPRMAAEAGGRLEAREAELSELLELFFGFDLPGRSSAPALARALARRARVLEGRIEDLLERDKGREEPSELTGFYRTLATHLFSRLTPREFADLYAQTVAYGLLAARCWEDGELDRRTLYERIPPASGILRDVFRYISLSPPPEIEWIVDDLVDLVRPASLKGTLQGDFGRGERDPILHFYETFLQQYDAGLRARRGVYYTPPAVVSYIVRSVDRLLRTRLDRPDGLADPRVWLLDPAAGTMTFVVEAFRCAMEGWERQYGKAGLPALVRDHLLPHSFGFELLMAPYAIGHLKMSLFLAGQQYRLAENDRVNLLLTNALETEDLDQGVLPGLPSLAREVRKAAEVKADRRICVVIGNPPYSGHSANRGAGTMLRRSHAPGDEGYYQVDGHPLGERNTKWLQDDYVKFLRFAQRKIDEHGEGVVGLVINHSYLDNATFRGLRRSLMSSFDEIYLLDLHGNRRKREVAPDGTPDENVFDIEQGVSILLAVKKRDSAHPPLLRRADLWGNRTIKARFLAGLDVDSTRWTDLQVRAPGYLFVHRDVRREKAYLHGILLPEIFPEHSVGVLTARDAFVIDLDRKELRDRVVELRGGLLPGDMVPEDYPRDTGSWKLAEAVRRAGEDREWESRFTEILYRPFDYRPIFYADYLIERMRDRLMKHLLGAPNLALVVPRHGRDGFGALITDRIAAHKAVSAHDINHVFPLHLRETGLIPGRPNVSLGVLRFLERLYGQPPQPEEILRYVYAVLYSEEYRARYAAFLATDFPRIPFPRDRRLFEALARLGSELIDLHLPSRPLRPVIQFLGVGSGRLGRSKRVLRNYREDERRIYVNEERQCFAGIDPRVWAYRIGGYRVLDHWLQDRAGRTLTLEEIHGFLRTATALGLTLEVQRRIDEIYPAVEEGVVGSRA